MEWPACLDEYEKLVIRMNTPRSVFFLFKKSFPSAVFFLFSFCSSLSIRFCAIVYEKFFEALLFDFGFMVFL